MYITEHPLFEEINKSLQKIRPYLQADGGDIHLLEVTPDYTVRVRLIGSCETCPYNLQTLKSGVELSLKETHPQIKEVVHIPAVNE